MFTTNSMTSTVSSAATILVGTAFLTIAALGIASPAHAKVPAGFQQAIEASIDNNLRFPSGVGANKKGVASLAVSIDADGVVRNVDIVKSSGQSAFDREAVRTANAVRFPTTGKARTVAMVIGFNKQADSADAAHGKMLVDAYRTDRRQLLATETTARPNG